MGSYLRTHDLVKKFGGLIALNGVSIEVRPNAITMLIGPNGSGKTTLINVVSGVYKPDGGRVVLDGQDITGWPPHEIYKAGLVRTFQIPAAFEKLTVMENLLVAARDHVGESPLVALLKVKEWMEREEELEERAEKILELLDLEGAKDKRASELSGGQMKLLEIGRSLMSEPRLVLMDEPVAGVNPRLAREIMDYIVALKEELGLSFLIVEHRLDIVLSYVDRVYAMHRGQVISEGAPEEVVSDPVVVEAYLGG